MEKRIETVVNLIMFLSLLATAWDLWSIICPGKPGLRRLLPAP